MRYFGDKLVENDCGRIICENKRFVSYFCII